MSWTNSETNGSDCPTCWVNPAWAKYIREIQNGTRPQPFHSSITLEAGADHLVTYKAPRLGKGDYTNPALAKYYRDWCNGKFVIPGLRVEIVTAAGSVMGPAKKSGKKITPLKKVKTDE